MEKSSKDTYKTAATPKQIILIKALETECNDIIESAQNLIAAAKKRTRLTQHGPRIMSYLMNSVTSTERDPHSWITAVKNDKDDLKNLINHEMRLEENREEKIYS